MTASKLEDSIEELRNAILAQDGLYDALRAFAEAVREESREKFRFTTEALAEEENRKQDQINAGKPPEPKCGCEENHKMHGLSKPTETNRKCGTCGAPNCQRDGHWFECKVPKESRGCAEFCNCKPPTDLPAEVKEKIDEVYGKLKSYDGYFREDLESLARLCLSAETASLEQRLTELCQLVLSVAGRGRG